MAITFACIYLRYRKRCVCVCVCGNSGSGEMCGKIEKLSDWNKNCRIGTKIGVVVDIDPMIMIVVTKRQKDKKEKKGKKAKRQNY